MRSKGKYLVLETYNGVPLLKERRQLDTKMDPYMPSEEEQTTKDIDLLWNIVHGIGSGSGRGWWQHILPLGPGQQFTLEVVVGKMAFCTNNKEVK